MEKRKPICPKCKEPMKPTAHKKKEGEKIKGTLEYTYWRCDECKEKAKSIS